MVTKVATVALVILVIGLVVGFVGATSPVATPSQQSYTLLDTDLRIAPNDYQSRNLVLSAGQSVNVGLHLDNQTIFYFYVMNQSQYYNYYGCAPACYQPLLGGSGTFWEQAGEAVPYLVNATASPSAPYSGKFTAPTQGTYYFVFDNSVGADWTQYVSGSGGPTTGHVTLTGIRTITNYSVNWTWVGLGSALLLVGGVVATAMWQKKSAA